jgi:FemAB-related protein (PEP-CTERM system-associated)
MGSGDRRRWDEFVDHCPDATFFHRAGWQEVVERAFGHDTYFLYAEQDGDIRGVLPLGHVKSLLFGNALVSAPFGVYGGIAAADQAAFEILARAATDLAEELNVDYLEMRNLQPRHAEWLGKDLYVTFRKEMDPDPEANLMAVPRKQRAMIRKGIKAGLRAEEDEGIDRFFRAYSESVRNLGTPVFPRRFFALLHDVFGDDCRVLTVTTSSGELVSSVMSYYFRDQVLPFYGGGTAAARALKGNDFMYWELMRRSCEQGIRVFDYGRSKKGTGSYRFKIHWGFEPEPLYYEYLLVGADEMPEVNPTNPRYRLFIEGWKRMPLWLSQRLGPLLARNLA